MDGLTLLREAESAGLQVHAEGDKLVVEGPKSAEPIALRLIEHKADVLPLVQPKTAPAFLNFPHETVLREAPYTRSDGIPTEWAQGAIKLRSMAGPTDINAERWRVILADAAAFMERFAAQAAVLGWITAEIWGVHRIAPLQRLDAAGLVVLLRGREIAALTEDRATIRTPTGKFLSFRRADVDTRGQRLLWEAD